MDDNMKAVAWLLISITFSGAYKSAFQPRACRTLLLTSSQFRCLHHLSSPPDCHRTLLVLRRLGNREAWKPKWVIDCNQPVKRHRRVAQRDPKFSPINAVPRGLPMYILVEGKQVEIGTYCCRHILYLRPSFLHSLVIHTYWEGKGSRWLLLNWAECGAKEVPSNWSTVHMGYTTEASKGKGPALPRVPKSQFHTNVVNISAPWFINESQFAFLPAIQSDESFMCCNSLK